MSAAPATFQTYDLEAIRAKLPLHELCIRQGTELRSESGKWVGLCPFHAEKSPSFTITPERGRGHCFGCGWSGDLFEYWGSLQGLDPKDKEGFKTIVAQLAGMCGEGPRVEGAPPPKPAAPPRPPATLAENGRPTLPPDMRRLRAEELAQLAALRGLSIAGLEHAVRDQRLGFSWWPYDWDRPDGRGPLSKASWVITDPERWCAQFRPLDGSLYAGAKGNHFKSSSTKNVRWPIGAAQHVERDSIVLLEGGADMLAAYQLLGELGWLEEVAVWCLFGSSAVMCPEALAHARGRRVRILADCDEPKTKTFAKRPPLTTRPGWEAAAKWTAQLLAAGAWEVSTYDLGPILPEGGKDLNDLVKAGTAGVDLEDIFDF